MKRFLLFASALLLVTAGSASLAVITSVQAAVVDTPVVVMATGDIAEGGAMTMANATATGDLIRAAAPKFVMALGDEAYPDGSASDFATKYDPTWGSFKSITKPTPGNHEYHVNPPAGYLGYFGAANVTNSVDGGVYYAWDIGNGWRGYALNSEIAMSTSSAQYRWLQTDLNAHPGVHIIAYWHQPRYLSGTIHSDNTSATPIWDLLRAKGTDIVMGGHEHSYQRFAKMNSAGALDSAGIREFVAGAGGNQTYPLASTAHVGLQKGNGTDYGVLKLTLHAGSYDWAFIASGRGFAGGPTVVKDTVLDSGTETTNLATATTTPPPTTTTTTTTAPAPTTTTTATSSTTTTTATSSRTTTTAAPPPATGTKHFTANESGSYAAPTALGYNVHDTGMSASTVNALPVGTQAMAWVGIGTSNCSSTLTSAFTAFVTANAANPKLYGFYITDEPVDGTCAAAVKAYSDYIHANAPGKKAFIVLTDWPGTYGQYAPSKTNVDLVGLDPYPVKGGAYDTSLIAHEVNAALTAGIPLSAIAPTFQTFGGAGWVAPTSAQLQSMLNTWRALVPSPALDYAYSWGTQSGALTAALITRTDWQSVMSVHNAGTAPVPTTTTTTTTPTTTTTTTVPTTTTKTPAPQPATTLDCPIVLSPGIGQTVICTYR